MTDWDFAVRIAAGGFGLVFILLALLSGLVWTVSRLILRFSRDKPKE
jgi:Na+-transporting methylmalonyl-CoA/oxaloacetate decarboxylase gamma subunit